MAHIKTLIKVNIHSFIHSLINSIVWELFLPSPYPYTVFINLCVRKMHLICPSRPRAPYRPVSGSCCFRCTDSTQMLIESLHALIHHHPPPPAPSFTDAETKTWEVKLLDIGHTLSRGARLRTWACLVGIITCVYLCVHCFSSSRGSLCWVPFWLKAVSSKSEDHKGTEEGRDLLFLVSVPGTYLPIPGLGNEWGLQLVLWPHWPALARHAFFIIASFIHLEHEMILGFTTRIKSGCPDPVRCYEMKLNTFM